MGELTGEKELAIRARGRDGNPAGSQELRDELVMYLGQRHNGLTNATIGPYALRTTHYAIRKKGTETQRPDERGHRGRVCRHRWYECELRVFEGPGTASWVPEVQENLQRVRVKPIF